MDNIKPAEVLSEIVYAAEKKAALSIKDILIRGILSGVFLGYATSLALLVKAQGAHPFVGAMLFPIGVALIVLLGMELGTGNYASLSIGVAAGKVKVAGLLRNWGWVFVGNFIGSILYAFMAYLTITKFGTNDGGALGEIIRTYAVNKTVAYASVGLGGWGAAFVSGVLCNWFVALGTSIVPYTSLSTIGKIAALWLPIMTFFALGYEHSVVNIFLIPSGMMLGAPISFSDWWVWNQIPVTLGNILGGSMFAGLSLYFTHGRAAVAQ